MKEVRGGEGERGMRELKEKERELRYPKAEISSAKRTPSSGDTSCGACKID